MRKMKLNVKVVAAFIVGAALAGSIATAAITPTTGTLKACADNRTQALFLSTTGTCSSSRTLVEIGGNGMNTKTISSLVTPSVVSISATTSSGEGTGSGSIYKSNSSSSFIITNNHVVDEGDEITVEWLAFLRPERRFADVAELGAQIARDRNAALAFFGSGDSGVDR